MQKEYIERAHVLKFMNALYEHHLTMRNYSADSATLDCMSIVINAPAADVVEVVRCKDCKYCISAIADDAEYKLCIVDDDVFPVSVQKQHFCSRGKRKEG